MFCIYLFISYTKDKQLNHAVYNAMLINLPGQVDLVIENRLYGFVHDNVLLYMQYQHKHFAHELHAEARTKRFAKSEGVLFLASHITYIPVKCV
jgi:hypothetical protein